MFCSLYLNCDSVSPAIITVSIISYLDKISSRTITSLSCGIALSEGFPIQFGNGPNVSPLIIEK